MRHPDGLLAGVGVARSEDILDRTDESAPPGADVGARDQPYPPPALQRASLRGRPVSARTAA
ncbi:hypothetical protein [Streptomyces fagopyri]|uniref:hypothetical protein n=1 Tax=Streptomyces fagopyri TaxID=2662397 RepID=UPI003718B0CB